MNVMQPATRSKLHSAAHSIHELSPEEINNPYRVLDNLFDYASLDDLRSILWHSFKIAMTGNIKDMPENDRSLVIRIYEHCKRLLEAAYLINEKQAETSKAHTPPFSPSHYSSRNLLIENVQQVAEKSNSSFRKLVTVIEKIVMHTAAEKIFIVHSPTSKSQRKKYDFLVLLSPRSKNTCKEYQDALHDKLNGLGSVHIWLVRWKDIEGHLTKGHTFFSQVCTPEQLLYDHNNIPLPVAGNINVGAIIEESRNIFTRQFSIAKSFFEGAKYLTRSQQHNAAAFMLHQATEQCLRALIYSVTSYHVFGHNLAYQLRLCNFFAPELSRHFPQDSDKEVLLFDLLNRAYTNTRYNPDYKISDDDLQLLLQRVGLLQSEAEQFFNKMLMAFKFSFNK